MTLKLISAEEVLYDGEVTAVTLPGTKGAFTVLRNHASLVSTLSKGKIAFTEPDGNVEERVVGGGIADIDCNVISVCIY